MALPFRETANPTVTRAGRKASERLEFSTRRLGTDGEVRRMVAEALGEWTLDEFRALVTDAGYVNMDKLTRRTGHPAEQIEAVCSRLRALGYPVYARTAICPTCGKRAPLNVSGVCRPCAYRRSLARVRASIAELVHQLPPDQREIYADTEAETLDYVQPRRHDVPGEDEEARAVAQSEAEGVAVHRTLVAAQKRRERIAAKVRRHASA